MQLVVGIGAWDFVRLVLFIIYRIILYLRLLQIVSYSDLALALVVGSSLFASLWFILARLVVLFRAGAGGIGQAYLLLARLICFVQLLQRGRVLLLNLACVELLLLLLLI